MNIKLDSDGDIAIESGEMVFITSREEIAQFISQKIKTFFGEWFLDVRLGIPYFSSILIKRVQPAVIESIFINEILATPGVVKITEFDINLDKLTRRMTLDFTAETINGKIDFSEVVN